MKVAERLIEKEGTLQGERVGMTIDTDALSHIMSVLTDLYSDPESAIIREYSTNAYDSHIEAGQTRPIEVTLPGDLSPFLRIRDFGIGLDADGIRDIYSRYGTSTKRDSDDVVGMLGLGCKSALTYCDQFTVVGTKDGTMTTVAVGRDLDGSGTMTIVDVSPTDEPNGLEVVIPAKRDNMLRAKAEAFFGWWAPGTALLNGKAPERHADAESTTWIIPDRVFVTDRVSAPQVVMGNVAYPVSADQSKGWVNLPRGHYPVFLVDIGDVNFTPSREALQSTRRTRETLERIANEFQAEYFAALEKEVADAPDYASALIAWGRVHALGLPKATWKGREIFSMLDRLRVEGGTKVNEYRYRAEDADDNYLVSWVSRGHRQRKTGDRAWRVPVLAGGQRSYDHNTGRYTDTYGRTLVFTGFAGKTFTPVKREKLEAWMTQKGLSGQHRLVFVKGGLTLDERFAWDTWGGDLSSVHQWAEVEAIKLTGPKNTKRIGGSYPGVGPDGTGGVRHRREIAADDIDPDKVLWIRGSWYTATERLYQDGTVPKDYFVIALSENRVEKFKRDFPKAQEYREYLRTQAKKKWDALTKEARLAACLQGARLPSWITKHGEGSTDPRVKRLAELAAHKDAKAAAGVLHSYIQAHPESPTEHKEAHNLIQDVNQSYPLLAALRYDAPAEHIILYVNAAYAAERGI